MARYKFDAKTGGMLILNEKTGRWNKQRKRAEKPLQGSFNLVPAIKEFVSHAGNSGKPELITSRSQLRRHERSNGIRQAGDFKDGHMIAQTEKRHEQDKAERTRLMRETNLRSSGGKDFSWQ